MARQLSNQAAAAKEIKRAMQKRRLECRATSESFSMGDSVRVSILTPDLPPEQRKEIEQFCNQYQYGHFDGMQDLYEYSNKRTDIPQSKFVFVDFEQSDECREAIRAYLADIGNMTDHDRDMLQYRVWSGAWGDFWETWESPHKPETPKPVTNGSGYNIEQHHHTKGNFDFFIVVMAEHVERDAFNVLRDSCKAAGGWYSRKWGSAPGGFAFRKEDDAQVWASATFTA